MSFLAAVERLDALGLELSPTAPRRKFSLDHMRTLARALGDPQLQFPSVLIAGTNGKGSTAATLAAILAAAGLRTGLYTSPHLTRVTERIRVSTPASSFEPRAERIQNGTQCLAEIPEPDFARLYFHVDTTAQSLVASGALPYHPSYFETLTAIAFLYFAEQQLDIAVLEVGLGGRLDATNIVEPLLSVITDIALDHQDYLGNTLTEIAREKAGILRPNGTLITLPQHPEANTAIGEAAIALNVRAISATPYLPDARVPHDQREPRERLSWGLSLPPYPDAPLPLNHYTLHIDGRPLHVRSPLAGSHQQRNIALAIAAALELLIPAPEPGAPSKLRLGGIPPTNLLIPAPEPGAPSKLRLGGIPATNLLIPSPEPGAPSKLRLGGIPPTNLLIPAPEPGAPSKLRLGGIPATNLLIPALEAGIASTSWPGRLEFLPPNLLLDVAHNPAGAWTLRAAIASLPDTAPRTLIFSCLRDKDLREMSQILFPLFDAPHHLILTLIDSPRAAPLDSLIAAARALDIPFHTAASPADALALARRITPPTGLILATGSVYLIGALRTLPPPNAGAPSWLR